MPTFRCPICLRNWPLEQEYRKCPGCEEKCSPVSNVRAMPADEAESTAAHLRFENFYEEWDESRPSDRLATDGLPDYQPLLKVSVEPVA